MLACATDLGACGNDLSTATILVAQNKLLETLGRKSMPSKHAAGKPRSAATCGNAARPRPPPAWHCLHSSLLRGVAKLKHSFGVGFRQRHYKRGQVKSVVWNLASVAELRTHAAIPRNSASAIGYA
jgi:hypothetical protein